MSQSTRRGRAGKNSPELMAAFAATAPGLRAEIVDGTLHTQPRPAPRHALAASNLAAELGPPFGRGRGGPGGWLILFEPELRLGDGPDIVAPDLAGWHRERASALFADELPYIDLAPDWVCEVLSPSTQRYDRATKLPLYAREGVRHLWLVDPIAKLLEVYRLEQSHYVVLRVFGGEERVRAEPFEAFELDLGTLWNV
jgi:Uma2 family endonuclease